MAYVRRLIAREDSDYSYGLIVRTDLYDGFVISGSYGGYI